MARTVSWWRVGRNIASLLLREFLTKGSYLILGVVIARWMGREAFGDYTLSLLFSRSFFTIADFGFGTWLVREVSQSRETSGRYFATLGVYRLLIGVAVTGLLYGILFVSHYDPSLRLHIFLASIAFCFIHLTSFLFSFFRAFEKMANELEVSLVKNILFVGGGLWAVSKGSLDLFYGVFIVSSFVALLYALWVYGRQIGWSGIQFVPIRLKGTFSIWMIQTVVMIYLYLDTVLLSFFRGLGEVGLYQAAYSFLEALFVLSAVLATALFPVFSRLAKEDAGKLFPFYWEIVGVIFLFSVPLGLLGAFGAKRLLTLFYGASFASALPALYFLLSGILFFVLGGVNAHFLIAIGKEKALLKIMIACTFFNLCANLWAIPKFGFLGASATTVISECLMFSLVLYHIVKACRG